MLANITTQFAFA